MNSQQQEAFYYRQATATDLKSLKSLAVKSWATYKEQLTREHWLELESSLTNDETYTDLLHSSTCFVCCTPQQHIIGMAFLIFSGNPTSIYDAGWSYIRFVSVDPLYGGQGIGKKITLLCIKKAKDAGEKIIALHTSELMEHAMRMYEKMGFTRYKEIDSRLGKRYWLYTMQL